MSEVTRSTAPSPKPVAPANRPQPGNASEGRGDAFSALLSLAADTQAAPSAPADGGAGETMEEPIESKAKAKAKKESEAETEAESNEDNPVTQMLGLADPRSGGRDSAAAAPAGTPARVQTPASATGESGEASKSTGVDISGLSPLATPEAIDPAALPPAAIAARNAAAATKQADARVTSARPETKRATLGSEITAALRAPAAASAGQQLQGISVRAGLPGSAAEAARSRSTAWAASTVSMDLSSAREADNMAGNAVSLTARLSELLTGRAQADGGAPTPPLGATQEAGGGASEAPSLADLLPTPDAPAEGEPTQLNHWSTQQLRHAHLRLGDGGLDSLDIRLSMQGQDLSVDFRSDNADIRHSLAQQANQSLASLLERSGIALADVSVGTQQRQPGGQGSDQGQGTAGTTQNGRSAGGRADATDLATQPLAQPAMRADGSRPLDLFV